MDYDHEMWKNCEANFEGGKKEVIEHPEKYGLQKSAEWSEEDEKMINTLVSYVENPSCWNLKCPREKLVAFIESLPKRFNLQPKQEWSEEDETRLTNILIMLKEYVIHHYSKDDVDKSVDWLENRLKSLRPQYHGDVTMTEAYKMGFEAGKASSWKPSEEQTNNVIVELTQVELGDIINGLYYLKEKYYEDCKEHNGTATIGLSDEFKFYFKRFNEVLDLYARLRELEKKKDGTTTDN